MAFTIFLQEGYRSLDGRAAPSQDALEAVITTIFEIVYLEARASHSPRSAALLAPIVHMCLTPFLGSEASNEFIDGKLAKRPRARGRTQASPRRQRTREHP